MYRSASTGTVWNSLIATCPWLRGSVDVWNGRHYRFTEDGIDFEFYFRGIKGPMAQFKIHTSLDTTKQLVGTNVTIENLTIDTYGPNIYYDVIPFEQLYTFDTQPPILVKIDGMPVLCKSTRCSYEYISSDILITGFTVSGLNVVIDGTNLPQTGLEVSISNQKCTIASNDGAQIQCAIMNPMVAGSWLPVIKTAAGAVPVDVAVAPMDVPLTLTSASPLSIFENGGDIIQIEGAGFPADTNTMDVVEITFDDGTTCPATFMSAT